jgi:hypothetical protein
VLVTPALRAPVATPRPASSRPCQRGTFGGQGRIVGFAYACRASVALTTLSVVLAMPLAWLMDAMPLAPASARRR